MANFMGNRFEAGGENVYNWATGRFGGHFPSLYRSRSQIVMAEMLAKVSNLYITEEKTSPHTMTLQYAEEHGEQGATENESSVGEEGHEGGEARENEGKKAVKREKVQRGAACETEETATKRATLQTGAESEGATLLRDMWPDGQQATRPLSFNYPTHARGRTTVHIINDVDYDMSDPVSVTRANTSRCRHRIRHSMDDLGMPLARTSTGSRRYNQENDDFIRSAHIEYATKNAGRKIPMEILVKRYQRRFRAEKRSHASIVGHVKQRAELRDLRNSYGK